MNNIILLIILILIIYIFAYNIREQFSGLPTMLGTIQPKNNSYVNNSPINDVKVNTYNMPYQPPKLDGTVNLEPLINGKQATISHNNYSLLNDPLFKDVVYYENDNNGRLGLDMCIESCDGNCVEYGQTGNAYCFPKK